MKTAAGDVTTVAEGSALRIFFNQYSPRINNDSSVAFSDIGAGGAVYFSNGGSLSDPTADKPLSTFTVFSHSMINGDGTVVFALAASSPPDFPNGAVFRSKAGGPAELAVKGPGTLRG